MKKILSAIIGLCFVGVAKADDNVSINWKIGNTTYDTTTCTIGGDIILPNQPTKKGYEFAGWMNGTPVEYLQLQGSGNVNTLISGSSFSTMSFELDFYFDGSVSHGSATCGVGGFFGLNNNCTFSGLYFSSETTTSLSFGLTILANTRYKIFVSKGIVYVNGQPFANYTPGNINGNISLWRNASNLRIYSAKIWDANDNLLLDLIPALDSKGVPAMYDFVSNKFFYNNGTGSFTAGPVLTYN